MSSSTHGQLIFGGKLRPALGVPRRACSGPGGRARSSDRPFNREGILFMVLAGATGSPPEVFASATLLCLLARLFPGCRVLDSWPVAQLAPVVPQGQFFNHRS